MDITEAFRQEDISKTDFFDFVVSPDITDSQLQLSKQMRSVNVFFETDLAENSSSSTSKEQNNNLCNIENTQPLAGFDQLWSGGGDSKENNRLESAILEDLSRYCWSQPQDSMPSVGASGNTDGQIYTLTVLNGTALEPWARTKDEQPAPLDIESILGLPGFAVKTETFSYEDSGFADNKEDINEHFHNNNNDWRLADHNANADSLLRSALQGKGYAKVKQEEDLRRALVVPTETILFPVIAPANDQDSLGFVDSNIPLFEEEPPPAQVDDIFLSHLDSVSYPDDYEKLKRIATEVQQFCVETYAQPAEVTSSVTTKPAGAKKYRRGGTGKPTNTATSSSTTSCSNGTGAGARKERSLHYCSICSKGFKDKYSVNVHIRTHTGEKPFACSLCGKSFRQKAHLAKHYQTHLAQKHAVPGVSKRHCYTPRVLFTYYKIDVDIYI